MRAGDHGTQSLLMYAGGAWPNGRGIIQAKDTLDVRNYCIPLLLNPDGGNVGIRTTVPASTLDIAGSIGVAGGYFQNGCPSGTTLRATNLCMDNSDRTAATFQEAQAVCRALGAHICTYSDVYSAWPNGNTVGNWLGNRDGDDSCLHINGTAQSNFEGSTNKGDSRAYRCCFGPFTP
jgi:hypothetical protein